MRSARPRKILPPLVTEHPLVEGVAARGGEAPAATGSWLTIQVDREALVHNIGAFRRLVPDAIKLMAVVKADAYGHGLLLAAEAFLTGGADRLGVHSLAEALALRKAGVAAPVLVLGPVTGAEAVQAVDADIEVTLPGVALTREICAALNCGPLRVHLKVDTGVNRQGICRGEWPAVRALIESCSHLQLVGVSSHFADIEDTTDHSFAEEQMARYRDFVELLRADGHSGLVRHMTCSAATLLWDRTHADLARVGIAAYGIWPSRETLVSMGQRGRDRLELKPALTWQVRISQVRSVPAGETVSYGRTWKAMTASRIAVLPVGYSDGWPRALSGRAHVLVKGLRAPVVGRICMNLCMIDVTHIPGVEAGDPAVLLGRQGDETITAEMLADQLGTIPYEVLTLPGPSWSRIVV